MIEQSKLYLAWGFLLVVLRIQLPPAVIFLFKNPEGAAQVKRRDLHLVSYLSALQGAQTDDPSRSHATRSNRFSLRILSEIPSSSSI